MNEDKILFCLLSHKALKSESEKNIMDILSSNHIISGNAEKDYCLAQGLLVRVRCYVDNGLGGKYSTLQISVSSLGETEIMRLWEKSELNPKVKREKKLGKFFDKWSRPILQDLTVSIILCILAAIIKLLLPTLSKYLF